MSYHNTKLIRPDKLSMHIDDMLTITSPSNTEKNKWCYKDKAFPAIWSQGRTAFGGVSSGMILAAMLNHVESNQQLRSYTTNFVGPIVLEEPVELHVEILRKGKNVSQLLGKIVQNGNVCVICQGVFGRARESSIVVPNNASHTMILPQKAKFIPQIPKVTPKFLRHFDLSIEQGGIPFTRKSTSHYHGWMRYKQAPISFSLAHLISIIDAWPPTLLQMLKWPAPASTVSWHIDILSTTQHVNGDDWLAYQATTQQANDGYGHTEAVVYDTNNKALALSRQTVAVFA